MSETHHEVEAEGVCEPNSAVGLLDRGHNLESAWSKDDCEGDPETAIGRERSRTEGVTNGHFPRNSPLDTNRRKRSLRKPTTCQPGAERVRRSRKRVRRRGWVR